MPMVDQERQQKRVRLTLVNELYQAGLNIKVAQFWIFSAVFGVVVRIDTEGVACGRSLFLLEEVLDLAAV